MSEKKSNFIINCTTPTMASAYSWHWKIAAVRIDTKEQVEETKGLAKNKVEALEKYSIDLMYMARRYRTAGVDFK